MVVSMLFFVMHVDVYVIARSKSPVERGALQTCGNDKNEEVACEVREKDALQFGGRSAVEHVIP